jgi:hypothetical protein
VGDSATSTVPAVSGENTAGGDGIVGKGKRGVVGNGNEGVRGESDTFHAIVGDVNSGMAGVFGHADGVGSGVAGESQNGRLVRNKLVVSG